METVVAIAESAVKKNAVVTRFVLTKKNDVIEEPDLQKWAAWCEANEEQRYVARTDVGDSHISTVFRGEAELDQPWQLGCAPMVFETLVVGGPLDGAEAVYTSWEMAKAGHARMVGRVREIIGIIIEQEIAAGRWDQDGIIDRSISRFGRAVRFIQREGLGKVARLALKHGARGSMAFVMRNVRYMIAALLEQAYDRRHNIDTSGDVPSGRLDTDSANARLGHQFVSTSVRSFQAVMQCLPSDLSSFVFVDIGSGKGRTLLLAAQLEFRQIVGIEYVQSLVMAAKKNVLRYRGKALRCRNIVSVCADATTAEFPHVPLVVYFYNPFEIEIFEKVFENIVASFKAKPRPIIIVYVSGIDEALAAVSRVVLKDGLFELVEAEKLRFYLDTPWQLSCKIFRADP